MPYPSVPPSPTSRPISSRSSASANYATYPDADTRARPTINLSDPPLPRGIVRGGGTASEKPSSSHLRARFATRGDSESESDNEDDASQSVPSSPGAFGASAGLREKLHATSHLISDTDAISKPWLAKPDPWIFRSRVLFLLFSSLGVLLGAFLIFRGYMDVPNLGALCPVLEDDFSGGLDESVWEREVQVGGFGNGQFEWTTADPRNSRVEDGKLYLIPTLTSEVLSDAQIMDGYNLTLSDCTSMNATACNAWSNSTLGRIINPVQSVRINTRKSKNVKYGRVEVVAKMPTGDWLWPAIWMLPVDEKYGPWPRSGEIDIVETRGNGPLYPAQGTDWLSSTIHWGPSSFLDRFWTTVGWWNDRHLTFDEGFHTYVLEWDDRFMWTYVDSRVNRILNMRFKKPFFDRGKFPQTFFNGTNEALLSNPWALSDTPKAAPFDQSFYLILDVAVGGTNGWFPDGKGDKPWVDGSATAMRDFYKAKDKWYPTWPEDYKQRAMVIDSVKMYQKC